MPFRPGDRHDAAKPGDWEERAACRDLDPSLAYRLFFPAQHRYAELAQARIICATCPVKAECLAFALDTHQDHGIWGGTSERERRGIRRRRRMA